MVQLVLSHMSPLVLLALLVLALVLVLVLLVPVLVLRQLTFSQVVLVLASTGTCTTS
jgi:hypothetical protein